MKSPKLPFFVIGIVLVVLAIVCSQPSTPVAKPVVHTLTPTNIILSPTQSKVLSPTPWPQVSIGIVQVDYLNIRSGPGTVYSVIGSLKKQDEFYILADTINYDKQKWLLIVVNHYSYGWVIGENKFVTEKQVSVNYDTFMLLKSIADNARVSVNQQLTQSANSVENYITPEQVNVNSSGDGGSSSGGGSDGGTSNIGTGCDSHYPDICVPPPPPDLDCPDIPYTWFRVLPGDPHGFDGDGDGWGCER